MVITKFTNLDVNICLTEKTEYILVVFQHVVLLLEKQKHIIDNQMVAIIVRVHVIHNNK